MADTDHEAFFKKHPRGYYLSLIWRGYDNQSKILKEIGGGFELMRLRIGIMVKEGLIRDVSLTMYSRYELTERGETEYRRYESAINEKSGKSPESKPHDKINVTKSEVKEAAARRKAGLGEGPPESSQPALSPFPEGFSNLYGCSMCARKGSLCEMHMQLDRDNRATAQAKADIDPSIALDPVTQSPIDRPPNPPGTSQTSPKTSDIKGVQTVADGIRTVTITVGTVIISVQEPVK